MTQKAKLILICLFAIVGLAFGLQLFQTSFKEISIFFVLTAVTAILLMPYIYALIAVSFFIWFQGFFKIVSSYNVLVHIGADLVVLFLCLKFLIFGKQNQNSDPLPPLIKLFIFYFLWIVCVYFNPYSVGLVPTIAGSKVYITMFLLYFLSYYIVDSLDDVKKLFFSFCAFALIQSGFTIYQAFNGPNSVLSLHPGYAFQLQKFSGYSFRPFGLTNIPGGPSVYMYVVIPFFLFFIYNKRNFISKISIMMLLPFIGTAIFLCQVRSAILKSVISLTIFTALYYLLNNRVNIKSKVYSLIGTSALFIFTFYGVLKLNNISTDSYEDNKRSIERSMSAFDLSTMSEARRGALDRFMLYVQEIPLGAGFSRVGASAGAFESEINNDIYFPKNHFFSDNLFIHLLIEIGLPGLIILVTIICLIIYRCYRLLLNETSQQLKLAEISIFCSLVAIFIGSYGGEGIIYNPESCFFWMFSGVLMKLGLPKFDYLRTDF